MPGEYRQPVPDEEWKKFSDQHEAEVEAERTSIHTEPNAQVFKKHNVDKDLLARAREAISRNGYPLEHPQEGLSPVTKLSILQEAGEITETQANTQLLDMYHQIPLAQRNYRRDTAYQLLPEQEQRQELKEETLRDIHNVRESLRTLLKNNPDKSRRLRDLLVNIENEVATESL